VANPAELSSERAAACERITAAARAHPVLVAGSRRRFCTELLRATGGRVFGKVGAEGVYTLGVIGAGVGMACKIDDGNERAVYRVVIDVLSRRGLLSATEVEALSFWASPIRRNWDGLEVGRTEVVGGGVVGGGVVEPPASSRLSADRAPGRSGEDDGAPATT
jgi:L-asparaginase II